MRLSVLIWLPEHHSILFLTDLPQGPFLLVVRMWTGL